MADDWEDVSDWQDVGTSNVQQPTGENSVGGLTSDTLNAIGGASEGYLKGFGKALVAPIDLVGTGLTDLIESGVQGKWTHVPGKGIGDYFGEGLDNIVGDVGQNTAIGRTFARGGNVAGSVAGLGSGLKALSGANTVTNFLTSNPLDQLRLAAAGGLTSQAAVESGLVGQDSLGQTGIELATMTAPDLFGGAYKSAAALKNALIPSSERKTGDIINAMGSQLPDKSVLIQSGDVGPLQGPSSQTTRELTLANILKNERNDIGGPVGDARDALRALSPEVADKVAYQSALKKELALATKNTDKATISKALDDVTAEIDGLREPVTTTESPFPLLNEKYGDVIPGIGAKTTVSPTEIGKSIDNLASANADFSALATDLKTALGKDTSRISDIQAATSKLGSLFIKNGQAAKAFATHLGDNPKALSLGRMSIFDEIAGYSKGSWASKIDDARAALKNLGMSDEEINLVRNTFKKGADTVGGATGMLTKVLGNHLAMAGLAFTGHFLGVPLSMASRYVAHQITTQPERVRGLLSQAMNDTNFAAMMAKKATPENMKAAIEYLTNSGRNLIMGTGGEYATSPSNKLDEGVLPSDNGKKKVDDFQDVDLTPQPSVPKKLVSAVIKQESRGDPFAVSSKGAQGLMQIMPDTGKEWHDKLGLSGKYDPFNKEQNKAIGEAYLGWLSDQFDGDPKLTLAAYNWGIGHLRKLMERTGATTFEEIRHRLPTETKVYVKNIMSDYGEA